MKTWKLMEKLTKKCNKQRWKSKVIKGNNLKKSIEYVIQWNAIHWRNFFSYMQNIFMLLYVNFCWWDKEKRIQIWINNRITTFNHYVSWKWKFLKISRNFTITISKITKMNCIFIFIWLPALFSDCGDKNFSSFSSRKIQNSSKLRRNF